MIAGLSQEIAVLFIEHDMDVVFRFARRIIVMVGGRILVEGSPDEIAADPRVREVYLGGAGVAEPLLALDGVRAGYGDAVVLDGISLDRGGAGQPRGARPQRRGQDDPPAHDHGLHRREPRRGSPGAGREITRVAPHRRARGGLGWVAQEREIFASLSVEENLTVAARPGRWDLDRVYALFPRLAGAPRQPGPPPVRRRAADAGDRARPHDQPGAPAAGRAARGAGAHRGRGAGGGDPPHADGRRLRRHPGRAARARSPCH